MNVFGIILILITVLGANCVHLIYANPNPLIQRSGMAVEYSTGLLKGLDTIDPNNGFVTHALGTYAANTWLSGQIPYWNHYEGIGTPLAAELQSGAISPFVILLHFQNGLLIYHIILEFIAGVATFLFIRKLGLTVAAATLAGVMFALNGTFSWLTNAVFNPIAFLPVVFLGIEYAYNSTKNGRRGGWLVIALALSLSLYSGFPETAFIDTLLAAGWALVRVVSLKERSLMLHLLVKLSIGAMVGLLLAAPVLVAFAGYLPYANVGAHGDAYANASLGVSALSATLMPYIYGPIFGFNSFSTNSNLSLFWSNVGGYFSVPMLTLAIFGYFSKLTKPLKIFLGLWIAACLMKVFGVRFVSDLINLIPTIKHAAFYRYANPSIAFALTVLASYGVDVVTKTNINVKKCLLALFVAILPILILIDIAWRESRAFASAPHYKYWAIFSVMWALFSLLSITLSPIFLRRKFVLTALALIVVVDSTVMFIIPQLSTPKIKIDTTPISAMKKNIGLNRFYTLGPIEPNYGTYFKVASINQNDLPVPKKWGVYINKNLDSNTDPLLFIGYYRKNATGPSSKNEFFKNIQSYENTGVKYLVTYKGQITDDEVSKYGIKEVYQNNALQIYLLSNPSPYFTDSQNACSIKSQGYDEVSLNCKKPTVLTRKELDLPGWKVAVNNKRTSIIDHDSLFQSIKVSKGTSHIKYTYLPPYMEYGYVLLILGILVVIGAIFDVKQAVTKLTTKVYLLLTKRLK